VTASYDLTPAEVELVHVAATGVDHLSRIELAIKQSKPTALGSAGQIVAHPLNAEWRATAETIRRICQQLDLPDLVAGAPSKPKAAGRPKVRGRLSAVHRIDQGGSNGRS
jgi:hypothetical protein